MEPVRKLPNIDRPPPGDKDILNETWCDYCQNAAESKEEKRWCWVLDSWAAGGISICVSCLIKVVRRLIARGPEITPESTVGPPARNPDEKSQTEGWLDVIMGEQS